MLYITQELVNNINEILSHGLTRGLGQPIPGQMCIEASICYAMGEPHTDKPSCVGSNVNKAKIALNDCRWSSNKARAEGMAKLAIAQLGSIDLDQKVFNQQLKLNSTRTILPSLIQIHFNKIKDGKLLEYKAKFEALTKLDNKMWEEFYYSDYYNCYDYYYYHSDYNCNYNYYDYYYNYYDHLGDEFLLIVSATILKTLQDMNCEGCKWLPKE